MNMKQLPKCSLFILIFVLLAGLSAWALWGNTALITTHYRVQSQKLPQAFSGLKIAQVSDLHNAQFGTDNQKLLAQLKDAQPDLIAITGDLVDSRRTNPEVAIAFVREAVKIAPTYYIPGNHESRLPDVYAALKAEFARSGAVILENESITFEKDGQTILLTGLMDPDFGVSWPAFSSESYQVVLSHRPELLEEYSHREFDLVLTGHAHGGQFRLPFIGGLFAPHQGFLPQYDSGIHTEGSTTMVVSRGLGNSLFPLRFNNRPELVIVTLESV